MIVPEIIAVVGFMRQVGDGYDVEILSEEMSENANGDRGVDIRIEDKRVFLTYLEAENMLQYPSGMFRIARFVNDTLCDDNPETFFKTD